MESNSKSLVQSWFNTWRSGNFLDLPIAEDFKHTSPFGTIEGKKTYLHLVQDNLDKFLGYSFEIHDGIYGKDHACVRYTATQGADFKLDVSEWYYLQDDLIAEIFAYYHIGEIREERQLSNDSLN